MQPNRCREIVARTATYFHRGFSPALRVRVGLDDLLQEGYILLERLRGSRPHSASFETYFSCALRRRYVAIMREHLAQCRDVRSEAATYDLLPDTALVVSRDPGIVRAELRIQLKQTEPRLSVSGRKLVRMILDAGDGNVPRTLYGDITLRAIAKRLRLDYRQTRRVIAELRKMMIG